MYTIRPTIRTEQNMNRIFSTALIRTYVSACQMPTKHAAIHHSLSNSLSADRKLSRMLQDKFTISTQKK